MVRPHCAIGSKGRGLAVHAEDHGGGVVSGAWRFMTLLVGTTIGVGIAVAGDVSLARRADRAIGEAAAAAPHGPEQRRLAAEISRYLDARKELDRRTGILARLRGPLAFCSPTEAMRRALAWGVQREINVNDLRFEDGELKVVVATGEPGAANALARDLATRGLIESPQVKWTSSASHTGLRWLSVSGRLAPPDQGRAPISSKPTGSR
jgi:hypothetical protein